MTTHIDDSQVLAFGGDRRLATGSRLEVALATRGFLEQQPHSPVLVFDAETSRPVELDLRGSAEEVKRRYEPSPEPTQTKAEGSDGGGETKPKRGPGRPKLGVVGREVTLLPRHWKWLEGQRGGASVTLRKLVDEARKKGEVGDRRRRAQESAYRFMVTLAGDRAGFEEAIRALYADDRAKLEAETEGWPPDVREHARHLAGRAFDAGA